MGGDVARIEQAWVDGETGRRVLRISPAGAKAHHIYPESYVFGPDERVVLFWVERGGGLEIWVADLEAGESRLVVRSEAGRAFGPAVLPDGSGFYFVDFRRPHCSLWLAGWDGRAERVCRLPDAERYYVLGTVSADGRLYATGLSESERSHAVVVADAQSGQVWEAYRSEWVFNPHMVFSHGPGEWLLIQENTGYRIGEGWGRIERIDELGMRLIAVRADGTDLRELAVGHSEWENGQGHQTWLGRRGEVVATIVRRDGQGGNYIVRAGLEGEREEIGLPFRPWHIGTDASGRWIVVDEHEGGRIFLVEADTGRAEFVCASRASCGQAQWSHPHPALSPGGRWIGFNSDAGGIAGAYVVEVGDLTGAS